MKESQDQISTRILLKICISHLANFETIRSNYVTWDFGVSDEGWSVFVKKLILSFSAKHPESPYVKINRPGRSKSLCILTFHCKGGVSNYTLCPSHIDNKV